MAYTYGELAYNKRPLTNDIALWVIGKALPLKEEREPFAQLTKPYKIGEEASQQDSCPVADLSNIRPIIGYLKGRYEGFRIRHAQLSGIVAADEIIDSIDDDDAKFLIAAGSIAVIARGYAKGADEVLLKNGILPLVSDEDLDEDTFVLIRNIRSQIGGGELEAYTVTPESKTAVKISLGSYDEGQLSAVIN